ncbi:GPN-loop GTPase [Candidatus Lokiarchaeum ossiferum]|uniref:GPN-loop GTPase n=1 Tax=Candidatus Lokiarchaeum ossiferum TaxID=2951803 RepID=A0ABY6HQ24_9ARCH|nr:GPN-loop GTPase [Candidatus Lokiarchaeum sp. B-35]
MLIQYIIGPAGSGKTTLTKGLIDYLQNYNKEISVISMNLDPAVQKLPYTPDIDIQDYITVDEVVQETGLGPNGAMIEATDRMTKYIADLKYEINQYNDPEIILIDTPGQMELFSFRNTGPMIANALGFGEAKRNILFCYDSNLCQRPNGFISTVLLAASVQYRFSNLSQINLLTKKDLLSQERLDMILDWTQDDYSLAMATEQMEKGMLREFSLAINRVFQEFEVISNMIPVSAKYNEGVDDVWGAIQKASNDDTSPYY